MAVDQRSSAVLTANSRPRLWLWPNLLGLDAPLVAVIWQILLTRSLRLHVSRGEPLVLALCVWFIYLADHVLDVRRLPDAKWHPDRKIFCRTYLTETSLAALALLVVILPLADWLLRPATFRAGLSLAVPLLLYMAFVHLAPMKWRAHWPREVVIACLFTLGTFLAAWTANNGDLRSLWMPALLFALCCWANCCAIETWEWQANDRSAEGQPSDSTRWGADHLASVGLGIAVLAVFGAGLHLAPIAFSSAVFLSGLALASLAAGRRRMHLSAIRVTADLALCTPLLLLISCR